MRKNKSGSYQNGLTMLILDDDTHITEALRSYFEASGFKVETENNPPQALIKMRQDHYDLLLLDYLMSPLRGDEVVERLREFNQDTFVIMLTGHKELAPPLKTIRELDIQGYYEKSDRFDQLELLVESCVKAIKQMKLVNKQKGDLVLAYGQLQESYKQTLQTVRLLVDAKDIYTRGHSDRVSYYASKLAQQVSEEQGFLERVRVGGLLHDVGKIGTSETILCKQERLTNEEFQVIQQHTVTGATILSHISMFQELAPAIGAHHERFDGHGYPHHLAGQDIPLEARIISIADAFDAMMSDRHYRRRLSLDTAIGELRGGMNKQFDSCLVEAFLYVLNDFEQMNYELQWTLETITIAPEQNNWDFSQIFAL